MTDISIENPKKSPLCGIESWGMFAAWFGSAILNDVAGIGLGSAGGVKVTLLYALYAEMKFDPLTVAAGAPEPNVPVGFSTPPGP